MAVSFIAASGATGDDTTVTPSEPTGAAEGDFLHVLAVAGDRNGPSLPTMGAGWIEIDSSATGPDLLLRHWYRFRGSSAPNYGVTAGDRVAVIASAYRGVSASTPFDGLTALAAGSDADTTYPAMTSAGAGRMAVRVRGSGDQDYSDAVAAGWTSRFDNQIGSAPSAAMAQVSTKGPDATGTEAAYVVDNDTTMNFGRNWAAQGFYLIEGGGKPKVWDGSAWEAKPLKVWNGSAWEVKPLKRWDGSAWVPV